MSPSEAARPALLALLLAGGSASGCVEHALFERKVPFDYAALPPPEPEPAADGAIWRGDSFSGSFLFFDQKARRAGDLVTVIVREDVRAEGSARTDLSRDSSVEAGLASDVGLADLVAEGIEDVVGLLGVDAPGTREPGAEVNTLRSSNSNGFQGEGTTERRGRFTAVITCRVVEVLPGNVFHIRGRRSLLVNHEEQLVTLEALVRTEDIGIDNTVPSAALAEARLTLDGIGVVDDKQRPGWLARAMDWLYPF